jgi:glycerophosphoryl diester phosphodiesterase
VQVLAHRGAPSPGDVENTVPAVSAALADGADGVEVDLRLTADGVLAVCHDPDLMRIAGLPAPVAEVSWQALHELAGPVPLARVEWVLAAAAGRHVVLELKSPPPAPRARARTVDVLVERLSGLHGAGLPLDVVVSSFDAALVRDARQALPPELGVRTALLGRPGTLVLATLRQAVASGHDQVHPHVTDLLDDPRSAAAAARAGLAVVPWTVNDASDLRRCADLGVDAVITDLPARARATVACRRSGAA